MNFEGIMKYISSALTLSLVSLLSACGGGDSNYSVHNSDIGFSDESNSNNNQIDKEKEEREKKEKEDKEFFEKHIKQEGSILFGLLDNRDKNIPKGFIDHGLDTFGNGVLKLAIEVHENFSKTSTLFTYYKDCHSYTENPDASSPSSEPVTPSPEEALPTLGCYVITGNNISELLENKNYDDWSFVVTAADLNNLQSKEPLNSYIGKTSVIIYENQNLDKTLNNIVVTGKFSYPYMQSWGLEQNEQIRFVTIPDSDGTNGGFNIYNDPTSTDGKFYVIQADSSYSVLTNDNPNTPNIEPVTLTVHSVPGDTISSFRIGKDGTRTLSLPKVSTVLGQRLENESPSTNSKSIEGSIYMTGTNVLNFLQSTSGSTIKYNHKLNLTVDGKAVEATVTGTTNIE